MNRNFLLFFSLSFFFHICLIVSFLFLPIKNLSTAFKQDLVSIQIEEQDSTEKKQQMVEQFLFNHEVPKKTPYLSLHNNTTEEEQKGKLGRGLNSVYQNISPLEESLSWDSPSSDSPFVGRIDFLDVQKEGDLTSLNTQEMWFFGFYSRVKNQIYWHWIQTLEEELQDVKAASLFKSHRPLITRIEALLDHQGNLHSVIVRKKSGLEELDEACVLAFQRAHPFPNPPSPMISKNGQVRLEYAFILSQNDHFRTSNF